MRNPFAANHFLRISWQYNYPHLTRHVPEQDLQAYKCASNIPANYKKTKMLDSLTIVFEKLFLLSNFNLFRNLWPEEEEKGCCTSPTLKRGDLLEVQRTLFIHCGIYLGDNKVAHLMPDIMPILTMNEKKIKKVVTNNRLILGCIYKKATIRVDTVEDFAYGASILVNTMDSKVKMQALSQDEVARRAEKLVGDILYSLLWNNCEHFATYCRYGSPVSQQTDKV